MKHKEMLLNLQYIKNQTQSSLFCPHLTLWLSMFVLYYISNTIMDFLYVILHHSNKIVKFKELKMVPKYQFSSASALKRFYRSQLTRAHMSETPT